MCILVLSRDFEKACLERQKSWNEHSNSLQRKSPDLGDLASFVTFAEHFGQFLMSTYLKFAGQLLAYEIAILMHIWTLPIAPDFFPISYFWLPDFSICFTSWLSDFLISLLSDFLTSFFHDFLTPWLLEFMTSWLLDFLISGLSDFFIILLPDFQTSLSSDFLTSWLSNFRTFWLLYYFTS